MSESRYGDFRERHQEGVWDFLSRVVLALIVFVFIAIIICAFIPLLNQQRDEASKVEELKARKAALTVSLARETREIDYLQHDPEYVETMARDLLDEMKAGETIFRFDQPAPEGAKGK